jgi:glycosyltransferase involved in cell wall biosynthesis
MMVDETTRQTRSDAELADVCVATHPLGSAGENATRTLMEILTTITSVSLVTADLPADSEIRSRHEVVELYGQSAASPILWVAALFGINQLQMCRVIARRSEDVILFFGSTSYVLPIIFARLVGKTVLIEPRGDVPLTLQLRWQQRLPQPVAKLLADLVRLLEAVSYHAASGIITYTPSMATQLSLDRFDEKLYPNGARYVDSELFSPQVPYEDRECVVGYLGRLDEEKGVRTLAAVAKQVPKDVTFVFAGDGELKDWLEAELADEIAAGSVEIAGWVDHNDVPQLLNRFKLLILPSQPTEGLPTAVLESMACGTPVYATPVSGTPDVVRNGETGFLIDEYSPDAIVAQISTILSRKGLSEISDEARAEILQTYTFDHSVDRYREILRYI